MAYGEHAQNILEEKISKKEVTREISMYVEAYY
jgi:hypothetical protein